MEKFLSAFFKSNVLIIEVLFGVVLLGIIFITARAFSRPEEQTGGVNLQSLEEGIKKILESHATGIAGGTAEAPGVSLDNSGDKELIKSLSSELEDLKNQLIHKNEEMEQLKANVGSSPTETDAAVPAPSVDTSAFEEKIKELEARLSEYAIIEDDIADLSFYKSENLRLQGEVEQLKAKLAEFESKSDIIRNIPVIEDDKPSKEPSFSAGGDIATSISDFNEIAENQSGTEPDPELGPMDTGVAPDVTSPSSASLPPVSEVKEQLQSDDAIMAEFEQAVAEQKSMTEEHPPAKEAEHNESEESTGPTNAEEPIDLEKMISEVATLPEVEGTEPVNVLEEALDTDRLIQEASNMEKIDTEALDKFDDFLKKEGA